MRFISERVKYPFFFIPPPLTFVVNSTMTSLPPPPYLLKNILQSFGILNYSLLPRWLICLVDSPSDTNQFEFCPRFFKQLMSMFSPAYDNKIFASHELMASYYLF